MKERIQKLISSCGVASRRAAEKMILAGRVTCNGKICSLGESADISCDTILLDGKPLPVQKEMKYIMLNKPRGFVTTLSDEKGRKNVAQLVSDCGSRVYPVGRLDMDSDGLLLLTNDGEFANLLMHPKHEVDKVYRVEVSDAEIAKIENMKEPVILDGYKIRKPDVKILQYRDDGRAVLSVTIHEGRNRQVRRMCAMAGMRVARLTRIAEGPVQLGDLPVGKWRYLTESEIESLK